MKHLEQILTKHKIISNTVSEFANNYKRAINKHEKEETNRYLKDFLKVNCKIDYVIESYTNTYNILKRNKP